MFLRGKRFTVEEMLEMENALKNSVLYSLELRADDGRLSDKLGLKVEYVTDMEEDDEAELLPAADDKYYGIIRLRKELEKYKFAYIHEIIHYIFDVGYGNKVTECFSRRKKAGHEGHPAGERKRLKGRQITTAWEAGLPGSGCSPSG